MERVGFLVVYINQNGIRVKTLLAVSGDELDILQAITIPFDDPKHLYYAEGSEGFPAFGVRAGSNVMSPFGLLFAQTHFYPEFAISTKFKSADDQVLCSQVSPPSNNSKLGL